MVRLSLFFSFELSYLKVPKKPRLGGALEVGDQLVTKTSCSPHFHCAEWSCVVLSDFPRHHNGSGRDWPDKSRSGKSANRPPRPIDPVKQLNTGQSVRTEAFSVSDLESNRLAGI